MKLSYFKTHWTPDEAHSMLMFLDELRDLIWQSYGSEITEFLQTQCQTEAEEIDEPFDDPIPF